nr:retrovirus-related Pol polyprotein from transposon TNT 1-94 [Tanacetum cinerariifolium]
IVNVVGARETVGLKRSKDAAYHMEKMLLCKQEEIGFQLNADQADWRDDTDDEPEDKELEAHYILESSNNHFNEANNELSKTNQLMYKDLKKFQAKLDRHNDVKYASEVEIDCAKAKGDLMSYKMESEKSFNEFTRKINDLNQTISKMKKKLFAHQETISIMSQQKETRIKFHKTGEDKELDKVIALENKVKVLDNIVYKTSQSVQTMNMLNRNCKTSFAKPEFLNEHPEQSKSVNDTYPIKQDKHNMIIDSLDMSYDRDHVDQDDDDDDDLANELDKLQGQIEDFKTKNQSLESSNNHFNEANNELSKTNQLMYKDLKKFQAKLDRHNDVKYASEVEIDCAKAKGDLMSYKMESKKSFNEYTRKINDLNQTISKMKKKLFAHQETISIMSQQKETQIKFHKTGEDKELDKVIALENKVKVLDNIVYKTSQSVQTMNMLNRNCKTSFAKPEFLKKAQRANPRLYNIGCYNDNLALMEYYYADHMNAILGVYTELDEVTNLQCDYRETLGKCECLKKELSKSKMMSTSFEALQNHMINLELDLQQCQERIKNDKSFKENQLKEFCKEREQYFEIQDLKAQLQDKEIAIRVISPTSISRPQLKSNQIEDRVMLNNSQGKKQEVEDHHRNVKFSKNKTSVTACNDSLNAKTSNHQRLSHLNFDTINLLSKTDIVIGLPKLKFIKDHLCSSCKLGKAKQKSFQTKTTPSSKRRLQLLHMDLCGPMRVESINGRKYVFVIVDDYSRYTWTHFLSSKDETLEVLINFLRLVQRGLHAQVRIVRTDKGMEFLNKTLHAYFASKRIKHQTSVARKPEQNGIVKRRNRTLVEAARTMLSAAKVSLFFWAEAISTTCFTQNRSLVIPRHKKTPYHIINDQKLSVKFFYIFGSLCYIVRDGENLDKMKEKGDACIFVGYSTQSRPYKVFNKRTRVIVETIYVNFDELPQMASDHVSSDPVPQCQRTALEHDSLSPGP